MSPVSLSLAYILLCLNAFKPPFYYERLCTFLKDQGALGLAQDLDPATLFVVKINLIESEIQ